ncbi:hypothetical protein [Maritimibacter sp. DP1N21-5]|uniref:hypothetical protein n=1 Tax=Maritimibacter sp. DP1N21-5 TaxID=2836867 RepID=UPI002105F21C|nr:hypothetical protein [Maritimibacter sp. DP1N21-5]
MTQSSFLRFLRALGAALILGVAGSTAGAACYADYKAKQDNPLKLHYGVIELPDAACASPEAAGPVVADRIAREGWTLLNVLGIFDDQGLAERKASAGEFFLRY